MASPGWSRSAYLAVTEQRAVEQHAARLPQAEADVLISSAYDNPPVARRRGWTVPPPVESLTEVAA